MVVFNVSIKKPANEPTTFTAVFFFSESISHHAAIQKYLSFKHLMRKNNYHILKQDLKRSTVTFNANLHIVSFFSILYI